MKKTKLIAINGIGIALFVALSLCLQIPVFENYYLCLGYVVMAVYCYSVGPISGTIVGVLGTVLYCLLINGLRGMPGWAIGNLFIGLGIGCFFKDAKKIKSTFASNAISIFGIIVFTTLGILFFKSCVEHLLYAQPILVRMASNTPAYIADVFMLLVSFPICKILDPHLKKLIK